MRTAALSALALLAAVSASAQFVQYTPPGSLADEQIPTQERLKTAVEEARYHLGPFRVSPWVALKDVAYVDNVYGTASDPTSDVTATVGLGAQAYLPLGRSTTLGMYALPEYVWWRDLSNRRGWNGAVGAGVFSYFSRLTVEIQAGGSRTQQYASSEIETLVNLEDRRGSALVELRVLGKLSLFGRGSVDQWRYIERGLASDFAAQLILLDRDEKRAGGGIRYHLTDTISLGLGAERYTAEFVHPENSRAASGTAPIAELSARTGHLSVDVNVAVLDLEPTAPSEFVPYRGTNGSFRVGVRPGGRFDFEYYGGRNLVYSIEPGVSYFLDERVGVAAGSKLGWRANGRVFWESGRDDYVPQAGAATARTDDFNAYGATVDVRVGRQTTLLLGVQKTEFTSSVAGFDRSVTQVRTGLQFSTGRSQWW